ncbi:helix-turn-helix domain-containing protein [Seleniivibrio woodruffii]|uniref:HTH-type transcriptional regulator/antitoxin HipB n=1 Tax=Seleniivibrio woodruffii TaxID=1078050 RepID=A0A4R1KCS5_9BACT|nr:helix-turn-helix domain-containing protein [Seleniivibrio woodruffii]TCK61957.1 HTH-type transcriptional regulator/antitoxin HipB [Seleniivibrio woodruffii]TVZ34926.1 HTH-type transcriptional regulator/antitoxin HipB [Seleniivibrio woodruffii]
MISQIISSPEILGHAIKSARQKAKLTQGQLAEKTGLRQATISKIENGSKNTRLDTLFIVLSELNLDMALNPKDSKLKAEW